MTDHGALLRSFPASKITVPAERVEKVEQSRWLPKWAAQGIAAMIVRRARRRYIGSAWYADLSEEQREKAREVVALMRSRAFELKREPRPWHARAAAALKNPTEAWLVGEVIEMMFVMQNRVIEEERRGRDVAAVFAADPDHEARVRRSREAIAAGNSVSFTAEQLRNRNRS